MRRPILRYQSGNLVTAKEAGEKNKRLGIKGVHKPRGYGHVVTTGSRTDEYTDKERADDAKRIFVAVCARAYRDHLLTSTSPMPPQRIRQEVRRAGGNIKWLSTDRARRHTFHYEYCQLLGRAVPFETVWQEK